MALSPNIISSAILSAGAELQGPTFPLLCTAIGSAVYQWAIIPGNITLVGVTNGLVGAGIVTGTLNVAPNTSMISSSLIGQGVAGLTSPLLAGAVSTGVASAFTSTGQYAGISTGVAVGTDISTVSFTNPAALTPLMVSSMTSAFGGMGAATGILATGLSMGIALLLQTAQGIGTVTGTPGGSPSVGTSFGNKVF